jgi:hypothetical protein
MGWSDKNRTTVIRNPGVDFYVDHRGQIATVTLIEIRPGGKANIKVVLEVNDYALLEISRALGALLQKQTQHTKWVAETAQQAVDP